jgi:2-keto-myo-inositol isomerase
MKPCVSETTTMPATFAEDVDACAAAGCEALEGWLTKIEQHLEHHSLDDTRRLLTERNVKLAAAAYQGGLLLSQGDARHAHFEHFRKRLELCQCLGVPTMLVVADFASRPAQSDLERAIVSLKQAAQWAAGFDVRLALEFRGADAFCSSLDTSVRLVEACCEPNVGVNLDVFHYYKGPSKFEDFDLLNAGNLAFVQICDLADVPRELATDSDRILPGDGDWPLTRILTKLQEQGYDGWVSLELMNPTLWQMKASQVMELGVAAVRRVLPGGPE